MDTSPLEPWLASFTDRLTSDGVIAFDAGGRVIASSDAARRILGRPMPPGATIVDVHRSVAFEEPDATPLPADEHPAALALRGVETHDRTVYAARGVGPRIAVLLDAWPVRGATGEIVGALLVLRDVGEAARAEAFREAFLARAGHELRNPLGALTTATQILHRRAKKRGDPPDRALEIVVESVQNLQKLVEELLDLSRIGRGRLELERDRVPLGPILQTAADDARRRFPEAKVEVLVAGEVVTGLWDGARLRQALRHLIENAIVHGKPPVEVRVASLLPGSVVIRVRDHGDGVAAPRREELWKPFVRRDRNVGMGLGLAVVNEIARAHGGRAWLADPEEGGPGVAAFLEVPIASQATA